MCFVLLVLYIIGLYIFHFEADEIQFANPAPPPPAVLYSNASVVGPVLSFLPERKVSVIIEGIT